MNRPAYEFVVANELYHIEGQEAFHAAGKLVNLSPEAREIKSAWFLLDKTAIGDLAPDKLAAYRRRHHTATLAVQSKQYLYGLVGLHITTKDLPNWLWATFEHVDTPEPKLSDKHRAGRPPALSGTKWEKYRLRGTQVDFVDSSGQPTVLANTTIEQGFQQSSSCITCDARATVGDPTLQSAGARRRANRLPFFDVRNLLVRQVVKDTGDQLVRYGHVGSPEPNWFVADGIRRRYTQLDFMWSLREAKSKNDP